MPEDFV